MPSFDVVSEVDLHELTNAVDQAQRIVTNRFDFKGVDASFARDQHTVVITAEVEFQTTQMEDMLRAALIKCNIDPGAMDCADPVESGKTVTVMATHKIRPGKEDEFEEGEIATMEGLKATSGMVGYQILKRIGLSTLRSGHATVESMMEDMKDSSGSKLKRTAEVWEGYTIPAEYLVMVEWDSLCAAQDGMPHVNVKPELLFIHGPKVLDNCLHMPAVRLADSMFTEHTYREILNGNK